MKQNKIIYTRFAVCIGVLLLSFLLGICAGSEWISPAELISDLFTGGLSGNERIVLYIGVPFFIRLLLRKKEARHND